MPSCATYYKQARRGDMLLQFSKSNTPLELCTKYTTTFRTRVYQQNCGGLSCTLAFLAPVYHQLCWCWWCRHSVIWQKIGCYIYLIVIGDAFFLNWSLVLLVNPNKWPIVWIPIPKLWNKNIFLTWQLLIWRIWIFRSSVFLWPVVYTWNFRPYVCLLPWWVSFLKSKFHRQT